MNSIIVAVLSVAVVCVAVAACYAILYVIGAIIKATAKTACHVYAMYNIGDTVAYSVRVCLAADAFYKALI
jgi:hypothetical protein